MYKRYFGFWRKKKDEIFNGNDSNIYEANYSLIELHQVVKTYHTAAGDFTALKGVDLCVEKGEFLAIMGKSGSGKSTILNMITGVDRPSYGKVVVNGCFLDEMQENQMAIWRGRTIGIVFQFFQLLPTLTVLENILLPMEFCNMYRDNERKERAMMLLEMTEMTDKAHKLPLELSGGQQQRVAIIRSLANDPPIIVADEPTGNLDSKSAETVFNLFVQLSQNGKTILMVTHDSDISKRAGRTITVVDGRIVKET